MPGYKVRFVKPLLERHECPVCHHAMKNPVQTECGDIFCRECLDPILKQRRPACPMDGEEINVNTVFPDNACRREILKLEVYCTSVDEGCRWIGKLKDLESHQSECDYRQLPCTQCGQLVSCQLLNDHMEGACPMRPQTCTHCQENVPAQELQHHIERLCRRILHLCPNNCDPSSKFTFEELEKHLDVMSGSCPLMVLKCPYSTYGCTFESQRKNLLFHFEQYRHQHIMLQAAYFSGVQEANQKIRTDVTHLMERVSDLESHSTAMARSLEQLQDTVVEKTSGSKLEAIEGQMSQISLSLSELNRKIEELQLGVTNGRNGSHSSLSSEPTLSHFCPNPTSSRFEPPEHRELSYVSFVPIIPLHWFPNLMKEKYGKTIDLYRRPISLVVVDESDRPASSNHVNPNVHLANPPPTKQSSKKSNDVLDNKADEDDDLYN